MIVVADTSPVNYLIQLGLVDVLADLYRSVLLPTAVLDELKNIDAPHSVRNWAHQLPAWCRVVDPVMEAPVELIGLDRGETEALRLALEVTADLVLIDELDARSVALSLSLTPRGTLGILRDAHNAGLLDAPLQLERLSTETSFFLAANLKADFLNLPGEMRLGERTLRLRLWCATGVNWSYDFDGRTSRRFGAARGFRAGGSGTNRD